MSTLRRSSRLSANPSPPVVAPKQARKYIQISDDDDTSPPTRPSKRKKPPQRKTPISSLPSKIPKKDSIKVEPISKKHKVKEPTTSPKAVEIAIQTDEIEKKDTQKEALDIVKATFADEMTCSLCCTPSYYILI
jgi:hypothetical protein